MPTMAETTLDKNNNDTVNHHQPRTSWESDDDSTAMAGSNRGKKDEVEQEKMVKWQIPGHHDNAAAKKIMTTLLAALVINHPNEITIIDRKQRSWTYEEVETEERFLAEFNKVSIQLHAIKKKDRSITKWVVITKISSTSTPKEWKNNDIFYSTMTENKAYIFPHPFGQDQWDVTNIGFIRNVHAVHYPKEFLHEQLTQMMTEQNENIPTFQLIPQRITTEDKKASTKAYTIQCLKDDSRKMIHLMTHGSF